MAHQLNKLSANEVKMSMVPERYGSWQTVAACVYMQFRKAVINAFRCYQLLLN